MSLSRRLVLAVAGIAVAGAAVGGAIVLVSSGGTRAGKPAPSASAASPTVNPALGPEGQELVALLAKGRKATFHARYQAASVDPGAAGQDLALEVWRKPPRVRQDLLVAAAGASARSATFLLPTGAVACRRAGEGPWSCRSVPSANPSADPDTLARQVSEQMAGKAIQARDETIGGAPTRCFALPSGDRVSEVCLTRLGIPARVLGGGARIELVEFSTDFSDSVFKPPA